MTKFLKFPKFNDIDKYSFDSYSFDIAWLKLEQSIQGFATPVPVVIDEKLLVSKTPVDLAGYGKITTHFSPRPFEKRIVSVHIDKFYNRTPYHSLLLFREPEKGMCHGDSGGPLFMKVNGKWSVAGVTRGLLVRPFGRSFGCKDSGVYTFPGMYIDWLERTSGTKLKHIGQNKPLQVSEVWPRDTGTPIEQICEKKELSKNE